METLTNKSRHGALKWMNCAFGMMGAFAVALGAFGAHALKDLRTPQQLEIWKTATFYLLVHATLGFVLSLYEIRRGEFIQSQKAGEEISNRPSLPLILMLTGTLIFSGALYALVLLQFRPLGAIAPIGGLMMITSWLTLALRFRT